MHTVFQSHHIPVLLTLPSGHKRVDVNDCPHTVSDTIDRFVELNVMNENSKNFNDQNYRLAGYPNGRKIQRRRRRGTVKKLK